MYERHQFIFHERSVFKGGLPLDAFHHTQIYPSCSKRILYLMRISAEQGKTNVGIMFPEFSYQFGENILRDGGTGSDAQFTTRFLRELLHVEIEILIGIDDLAGMVKHKLSGTGELDAVADSVEQLHPIFLFKLLYVLADGRLTDE